VHLKFIPQAKTQKTNKKTNKQLEW